jgi:putative ABC transport system permease protein
MLRHFLTAALRNMAANRLQSAIAIFGLAIGLMAAILAGIIIHNQAHFDSFIPGSERVYLVAQKNAFPGMQADYSGSTPHDLAALLRQKFPQVEAATRMNDGRTLLRHGTIEAREYFNWADANFFRLLPLPVLYGDLDKALARPDGIVIPREIARKYFGRDNVVGQTLIYGHTDPHVLTVTAVIEDLPSNATNFRSGIFISGGASFSSLAKADRSPGMGGDRIHFDADTLVRLAPKAEVAGLERDIAAVMNRLMRLPRPASSQGPALGVPAVELHLLRRDQMHLSPGFSPGVGARLAMMSAAAVLILVLACVNFVNLSTARAARRGIEVGIRKATGASRRALVFQFLGESVLQVVFALCAAVMLVELSLPSINAFLNSGAVFPYWRDPGLALALVGGALIVGVLAGAWPAFVLSGMRPASVLKGVAHAGSGMLRHVLVAVQFVILILLIIAAVTVLQQYRYASRDALRVAPDQMLFVRHDKCQDSAFNTGVRTLSGVRSTACSSIAVLPDLLESLEMQRPGGTTVPINLVSLGYGFLEQYGLTPVAGRFFSASHGDAVPADATLLTVAHYVINESAVRALGFASPQAAIGQPIRRPPPRAGGLSIRTGTVDGADRPDLREGLVIGVVRDFSLFPLDKAIRPIAYYVGWTMSDAPASEVLHVKLRGRDIPETLAAMDTLWATMGDGTVIQRTFLDAFIQEMVVAVQRQGQAFGVLAGVAVLLACLGLFGLSIATAQRRTKEIGIRKAMGASSGDIVLLLLWQFLKPVLWAGLIAMPLAWWLMQRWLSGYAYHIALGPWPFLGAAVMAVLIALATVITHAVLTARAVPATALRYE